MPRDLLAGFSIEVTPRALRGAGDLTALLPRGTTVYIAHIAGTPFDDMLWAAKTLRGAGFQPQPHFPARLIADRAALVDMIHRYQDAADVRRALVLGGGPRSPVGDFDRALQLIETEAFDRAGFTHLFFAGHPEGSPDLDPSGGTQTADAALVSKRDFAQCSDAQSALVTQFVFDAQPVIDWTARIASLGVDLPVHVGLAGPAKLSALIRFGLACGVGSSLQVLNKRRGDLRHFLFPMRPDAVAAALAAHVAAQPTSPIAALHLFPIGGIKPAAHWATGKRF
ncbi:methylenetetrahydrofolate reductase [Ketogulonicigenium vulgare]|uniref:5,10-methylenetetrahydrofolate reductase, putative n=1 Tax=Ketogulonicigenium vulgare (strain WSH-001) TaxID=759362 RepID=F9Y8C9_KETVW|nr:methylenetetrahydrofolate reductase [Ketogulonicigenium vulgare]ADO41702.1 metF-like protein [Ketogulonicigenium vulgare Y25]AEM39938.1 5,10-methylenetetrahydrofolate reductase, putative [Ketogulonicigenium vulgare WSH-001]ALJ80150.1 methylenetetrahydrofolate reductase [Ketogulonicigenium vulgare]ANW33017.1 5,10-methylenetetrahydrofolate reductase [Ketogulonicigenium vulgare]AOZ53633.1 metF-like protein [Ketogulonicigenium vulgare]